MQHGADGPVLRASHCLSLQGLKIINKYQAAVKLLYVSIVPWTCLKPKATATEAQIFTYVCETHLRDV